MKHAIIGSSASPLKQPSKSRSIRWRDLSSRTTLRDNDRPIYADLLRSRRFKLHGSTLGDAAEKNASPGATGLKYAQRGKHHGEDNGPTKHGCTEKVSIKNKLISDTLPRSPIMARSEQGSRPPKQQAKGMAARRLARNPWAKMLASPLRQCNASISRFPRDLLIPFTPIKNPAGADTHLMPLALADLDSLRPRDTVKAESTASENTPNATFASANEIEDVNTNSPEQHPTVAETEVSAKALTTNVLDETTGRQNGPKQDLRASSRSLAIHLVPRKALIHYATSAFNVKGTKNSKLKVNPKIIPYRWNNLENMSRKEGFLWRRDMSELIASLLKRRVVMALENVVQTGSDSKGVGLLMPLDNLEDEDLLQGAHTGAIIYFDSGGKTSQDVCRCFTLDYPNANKSLRYNPDPTSIGFPAVQLPLLPIGKAMSIPVFDMRQLLEHQVSVNDGQPDFLGRLKKLLSRDGNPSLSTWWLLRSAHASSVQALDEIWHLAQYTMFDSKLDDLVGVTTAGEAHQTTRR